MIPSSQIEKMVSEKTISDIISIGMHYISKTLKLIHYRLMKLIYTQVKDKPSTREGRQLYPASPSRKWQSYDEHWNRVVDRFEHRSMLQNGRALCVDDNEQDLSDRITWDKKDNLTVNTSADTADRWIWLELNPAENSWRNFRWEFDVTRHTEFRELQFGFRHNGFYDRYRFQHEHGKWRYEKVVEGKFEKHYPTASFNMEMGQEYRIEIEVIDNWFTLRVDGETLLEEIDFSRQFKRGSCAIVLWEDGDKIPIKADIQNIRVTEIIV